MVSILGPCKVPSSTKAQLFFFSVDILLSKGACKQLQGKENVFCFFVRHKENQILSFKEHKALMGGLVGGYA